MDKLSSGVGGILANRDLVREMKQIAKAHDIPYQIEAYAAGATDASFMQTLNGGIKSGGIQIPMRYVHSYEVCDIRDVVDSVELLYWYVKDAADLRLQENITGYHEKSQKGTVKNGP